MGAVIEVRSDHTAPDLRRFARLCSDPDQVRRLLAIALILDGGSRSEAAKLAGVTLQIVRDWALRFHADGPGGGLSVILCAGRFLSSEGKPITKDDSELIFSL